ncbi:hypothetical protein Gpo141_00009593 [Globisporangium polare]
MNLATLWTHERTRMSMQTDDVGGPPHGGSFDVSASIAEEWGGKVNRAHVPSSLASTTASPTASQQQQQQQQHQQQATPKRRSTVFAKRELVFKKLVDESVVPAVTAVAAVQNFFDCNEFAMEYADRAPKRFYAPSNNSSSGSSASCLPVSTSNTIATSAGSSAHQSGAANTAAASSLASPLKREKRASVASTATPRALQSIITGPGSSTRSSATSVNGTATTSSLAGDTTIGAGASTLGLSVAKPSFLSRKNGRKKLASEFTSARAFRPYLGDMFGTRGEYIDGMLYMSRMKRSLQITFGGSSGLNTNALWGDMTRSEGHHVLKDGISDALSAATSAGSTSSNPGLGGSVGATPAAMIMAPTNLSRAKSSSFTAGGRDDAALGGGGEESVQMKQRRRCALTLSNWSSNSENAVLMVQENVVEALMLLCKANDSVTRLHCVTALMNLSHVNELRQVIVRQGAVKTVSEIVDETEDKTLRTACAITLCNLCCLEGEEEVLVEDGAVSALSVLITEQPKVSWLCRSALFNLTCVREPYQKIESVLKMFITLTTSSGSGGGGGGGSGASSPEDCDEITAKALCNLSNFKRVRLRLMEEGIVGAIASLIHINTPDIQEMLAYVMLNLSALKACRSEMVAKGCMGTLVSLTGATSASTAKLLIASTLFNLSKEAGNRLRMVFEGLLLLVNELCRGSMGYAGGEVLRTVCARTLYNISCNEDTRVKLVERDGVSILSSLSRRTNDNNAKKMCTLALCNLLGVQQAAADIMNAGAITALIQLSMTPDQSLETKRLFSKALHGLCEHSETRDAVTRAGVIPAILYLSSSGDEASSPNGESSRANAGLISEIRARCTAALACLAADEGLSIHVCNVQVVLCVTKILVLERSRVAIERFCCSCLSLLCRDEECSQIMADEGAIQVVLSTCMETSDLETKASCCHVLASMSCHPSCCMALVRMGVISVLATLAKIKEDKGVQRCCAITLANLSVEPSIRDILVTAGIVTILAMLSNSYSEESQRDCAKVLCNLSCVPGNEAHLVREGAIGVLMMISMLRAVNASTKETCARALFNLLNAETIKAMVQDGLVKILPAFATLELGGACEVVTMVFMKLVAHPIGRNALCVERSALRALFTLMERASTTGQGQAMQLLFESLLCELVYYENSRLPSVNAGIIDALHRITMMRGSGSIQPAEYGDVATVPSCSAKRLALVLFTLSKYEETRLAVASSASIATLTAFLKRHAPMPAVCEGGECVVFAVSTFCSLAWHESTRSRLEHPEISRILVQLLTTTTNDGNGDLHGSYYPAPAIKTTLLTLCCISHSQELLQAMLSDGVIDCLHGILSQDSPQYSHQNLPLILDQEFLALVCILFRQLSHASSFSNMVGTRGSLIVPLFCTLTSLVAKRDPDSSLDCADALCSVAFAAVKTAQLSSARDDQQVACASLVAQNVVEAIDSLMTDAQLPETRWRCTASLWALSLLPEYRSRLVSLGCTRILVGESYRAESAAYLSILKCCAGALCNFTIPAGSASSPGGTTAAANGIAAKMVDEDAVPALLQLSKLENAEVREHCTLALTNLSSQSPKVESGAVSALLNLSWQATSSSLGSTPSTSAAATAAMAPSPLLNEALCRPPIVCGDRHKQFSRLPDFAMQLEENATLGERKYEADLVASTPPPPHLPTISVVLDASSNGETNGGSSGDASNETDELLQMRPASTSEPGEDGSAAAVGPSDRSFLVTKNFPKVDPSESRLLGGGGDADDTNDDNDNDNSDPQLDSTPTGDSAKQETGRTDTNDSEEARNGGDGDPDDAAGEQDETLGRLRKGPALHKGGSSSTNGGIGYYLSPLARVVVRKTQASQAAKKLKELRRKRSDGSLAADPANLVATLSSGFGGDTGGHLPPSRGNSVKRSILSTTGKSGRGPHLTHNQSFDDLPVSEAPSPAAAVKAASKRDLMGNTGELSMDPRSSLAAAAAAARLYGVPVAHNEPSKTKVSTGSKKPKLKLKTKAKAATGKPEAANASLVAKYLPSTSPLSSEDEEPTFKSYEGEYEDEPVRTSAAIADFRAQAKKLGLWS